ncbi:MAG TPA: DapH/DapD/GlmU-related protein, partial [Nitriliruptorales bacterium]
GKHVLVEKPMALTREDAREMQSLATERGLTLMVDHVLEYHPAVEKLHALVHEGELGRLLYVSSHRLNFGRVRTEEDALWSFAPHDLSLMVKLLGASPTEIACRGGAYLSRGVADVTLMSLEWPGDVRGYVFVSWLHPFKEHRFIVVGDQQMAVFDDTLPWDEKLQLYPHRVDWLEGRIPVAHRADAVKVELEQAEPLKEAAKHFLHCIETGEEPRTGAANGIAVVELLEAGRRSLETRGATIPIGAAPRTVEYFVHPTATVDTGAHIGSGTKVWHHTHVMPGARIGDQVVLGQDCYVGSDARIGNNVRIQNNVSVYDAVTLEDHVFVGPSAVFTNVVNPRSEVERKDAYGRTLVRRGATLGANCTIVCPVEIGAYAFVGAGAVVTKDVQAHALVVGNPAQHVGWMCTCGTRLDMTLRCGDCQREFAESPDGLTEAAGEATA